MRALTLWTALLLGLVSVSAWAGSFTVITEADEPVPEGSYALQFSFPLPEGAATDLSEISVLVRDELVPADLRELDRWPDGSLKWVRADVVAPVQGTVGPQQFLRVAWDEGLPAADADPLPLTRDGDSVTVR
ncbi:MAG: hypothetical protein GF393_09995, partial [Armatimonadia bacterium]|nr:hypothetical protein [Armatimonadia bacterium]